MKKRRYIVWGAWTALAAPLLALIAVAVMLAISYDGKCGGFMPWLASAKPCTLAEYVLNNVTVLALIVWFEFWPFIIAVLALPVGVGYMLDRRAANHSPQPLS
jgi:hypothetical protein